MAIRLTQTEADMLIGMLKRTVEQTIVFPNSQGKIVFDVQGDRRDDIFVVNNDDNSVSDDVLIGFDNYGIKIVPFSRRQERHYLQFFAV